MKINVLEGTMGDLVVIASFPNSTEAYLAQEFLSQYGIDSFIIDENMGTLYPFATVGGVKLEVKAEDSKRARELLDSLS
jgi:hypothetical protein